MAKKMGRGILFCLCLFLVAPSCSNPFGKTTKVQLTRQDQEEILKFARLNLTSDVEALKEFHFPDKLKSFKQSVIIAVYGGDGILWGVERYLGQDHSLEENIRFGIENLLPQIIERKQKIETKGTAQAMREQLNPHYAKGDFIHIQLIQNRMHYKKVRGSEFFASGKYIPLKHGIIVKLGEQMAEIKPIDAISFNIDRERAINGLAEQLKITTDDLLTSHDLEVWTYEVNHFGEGFPNRQLVRFNNGMELPQKKSLTLKGIKQRELMMAQWYLNNLYDKEKSAYYAPSILKYGDKPKSALDQAFSLYHMSRLARVHHLDKLRETAGREITKLLQLMSRAKAALLKHQDDKVAQSKIKIQLRRSYPAVAFLVLADLEGEIKGVLEWLNWLRTYQSEQGEWETSMGQDPYLQPSQVLWALSEVCIKTQSPVCTKMVEKGTSFYAQKISQIVGHPDKSQGLVTLSWLVSASQNVTQWNLEKVHRERAKVLAQAAENFINSSPTLNDHWARNARVQIRARKEFLHDAQYLLTQQYTPVNTYPYQHRDRVMGAVKVAPDNNGISIGMVNYFARTLMTLTKKRPPSSQG